MSRAPRQLETDADPDATPPSATPAAIPVAGAEWPEVDRRASPDRRHQPTPFWAALRGLRRRRGGRRSGENRNIYVDAFRRSDVLLLVAIFSLNLLDAFFTLVWLERGGSEANPIMAWLLDIGDPAFLVQKCFVVGLWLIFLLVHKNFRIARVGLWAMLVVYSLLLFYHLFLIAISAGLFG